MRHRALAAEVGHRDDRPAARGLQQRLGRRAQATSEYALTSSAIQKRSRGVSVNRPSRSSAAANATEWTSEVELAAERLAGLGARLGDVVVGADVALGHERAFRRGGELADAFSIRSPWKVNASRAPPSARPLCDRPGDRAPVCDAEDERALAREVGHEGRIYARLALVVRRAFLVTSRGPAISASAPPPRCSRSVGTAQRVRPGTLPHAAGPSRGA